MQQVIITKENGVELTESKTRGIYCENIVSTKADGTSTEIVYADRLDRRIKPKRLTISNAKADVDGFITGDKLDLTVYDVVDGTTSTLTVQEKFVKDIREATTDVGGTATDCRRVEYVEGAFATKVVFVSNTLVSLATAVYVPA